jgi:hypothetical protein
MNKEPNRLMTNSYTGRWRTILLGLLILMAGIVIGASGTVTHLSAQHAAPADQPELLVEQMVQRLGRDLDLTPRQRQLVEPLLYQHYCELRNIRAEVQPRIAAQLEELDSEISSLLDDSQSARWQRKVQRLEENFPALRERRRDGSGMGRGMGGDGQRGGHGMRQGTGRGERDYCPPDQP